MPLLLCAKEVHGVDSSMNIVYMQLGTISPYEKNPRKNDDAVEYVANSIREFGFKVPIVIDKDGVIVAGHTRYKAAKKLKMENVPCIVADDLTDEQIKAFRLADNKTAEMAAWDMDMLNLELNGLLDFDMADFGFVIEDPLAGADALDLDDDSSTGGENQKTQCHCPKCGFVFEVQK